MSIIRAWDRIATSDTRLTSHMALVHQSKSSPNIILQCTGKALIPRDALPRSRFVARKRIVVGFIYKISSLSSTEDEFKK